MGLTLSSAEDLSACFTLAKPSINALSWLLPSSPLRATCTLQPWCPWLLHIFSLTHGRREFSFCADSPFQRGKRKERNPNAIQAFQSPTLQRHCLPGRGHQCFYSVFLHVLNFGNRMFSYGKHTHFIYTVLCLSLSHVSKVRLVCVLERMH